MNETGQQLRRIRVGRNRSCLLLGLSWSHDKSFPFRLTHVYLGPWLLTIRTGGAA
jgi:hypothetical protein